ncbi:MAG: hypothetical protein H6Q97_1034 [Nitrospirae bacterium]|nr:hypothetical protein [Nitrospirota bacterium]
MLVNWSAKNPPVQPGTTNGRPSEQPFYYGTAGDRHSRGMGFRQRPSYASGGLHAALMKGGCMLESSHGEIRRYQPRLPEAHLRRLVRRHFLRTGAYAHLFHLPLVSFRVHGHQHSHAGHRRQRYRALRSSRSEGHPPAAELRSPSRHRDPLVLSPCEQRLLRPGTALLGQAPASRHRPLLRHSLRSLPLLRNDRLHCLFHPFA